MTQRPTAVITGTTSGIGAELAVILATRGYNLVLVNRSRSRTQPLLERIRQQTPETEATVYEADLSDQEQVRSAVDSIRTKHPVIQALFNNAGVLMKDTKRTEASHEMQLAVNVFAPYLLTVLLKDSLAKGAKQYGRAIVVTASSNAIFMTHSFDVSTLNTPRKPGIFGAYAQSKLAVSVLMNTLAPDFSADNIELYAIDPGGTNTAMTAGKAAPFFVRWMRKLLPGPGKAAKNFLLPLQDGFAMKPGTLISGGKAHKLPKGGGKTESKQALLAYCAAETGVQAPSKSASV